MFDLQTESEKEGYRQWFMKLIDEGAEVSYTRTGTTPTYKITERGEDSLILEWTPFGPLLIRAVPVEREKATIDDTRAFIAYYGGEVSEEVLREVHEDDERPFVIINPSEQHDTQIWKDWREGKCAILPQRTPEDFSRETYELRRCGTRSDGAPVYRHEKKRTLGE